MPRLAAYVAGRCGRIHSPPRAEVSAPCRWVGSIGAHSYRSSSIRRSATGAGADRAPEAARRVDAMKRILCTLVALGLVGASSHAWASCRWFGTQLECELGG